MFDSDDDLDSDLFSRFLACIEKKKTNKLINQI